MSRGHPVAIVTSGPCAATYCGWPLSAQAGADPGLQGALTGLSAAAGGAGGPGGHCQHPG